MDCWTTLEVSDMNSHSWTRNESFDKFGFLTVRQLCNPKSLYCEVPPERGQYNYSMDNPKLCSHVPVEAQVEGSISRYWFPQYRQLHTDIRAKLENILGRKLYNTYYYDRFYFSGQELAKHIDRDSCEISVTVNCSTNLKGKDADWPIWIETPEGNAESAILQPGDGMIYKGCERPHWREPMPTPKQWFGNTEYYYHQIFFHYVLADGHRAHFANDRG